MRIQYFLLDRSKSMNSNEEGRKIHQGWRTGGLKLSKQDNKNNNPKYLENSRVVGIGWKEGNQNQLLNKDLQPTNNLLVHTRKDEKGETLNNFTILGNQIKFLDHKSNCRNSKILKLKILPLWG